MGNINDKKLTINRRTITITLFLILAFGLWYALLYLPIRQRIRNADTIELEDAIMLEELRTAKIRSMQSEIRENQENGAPVVPSYDNFKEEAEELNRIFGTADHLRIEFAPPERDGTTVRRNAEINCTAKNYEHAADMLHELLNGENRVMVHDVSIFPENEAEGGNDILKGAVRLSFLLTYYETAVDAESTEGITVWNDEDQTQME